MAVIIPVWMTTYRLLPPPMMFLLACLLIAATGCTILVGEESEPTPIPVPTSIIPGLQVVAPQACLLAEQGMVQVEQLQGDLVAWSPVADTLAYIASTRGSTWNVGDLTLLTAPAFDTPVRLATQAAGEITWSPTAIYIAYLSLRRSDNLYTIALVSPDGLTSRDLFPAEAARTDSYSSQKAIQGWRDEGRLRVLTSCGIDCMQRLDFGILSGLSTPFGQPLQRSWDMWSVHTSVPEVLPAGYSDMVGQLNGSSDGTHIAYIDPDGYVWVINLEKGEIFPLDIGVYGTATETDWSYDGRYLAVKVDQTLKIFSFDCP